MRRRQTLLCFARFYLIRMMDMLGLRPRPPSHHVDPSISPSTVYGKRRDESRTSHRVKSMQVPHRVHPASSSRRDWARGPGSRSTPPARHRPSHRRQRYTIHKKSAYCTPSLPALVLCVHPFRLPFWKHIPDSTRPVRSAPPLANPFPSASLVTSNLHVPVGRIPPSCL